MASTAASDVVALLEAGVPFEEVLAGIDRDHARQIAETKKTCRRIKRRHRRQDARDAAFLRRWTRTSGARHAAGARRHAVPTGHIRHRPRPATRDQCSEVG